MKLDKQGGRNSRQGRREKPRSGKGFNWIVRICCLCVLIRGLQNLEASLKGFNCCGAKLRLWCADSRFAKPRSFLRGRTSCHFLHRAKSNQKARQRFANLWTPGTIQIAGRYVIVAKTSDIHQVTGFAKSCNFAECRRQ